MKAPDKIYLYHEQPKDYFDEYWNELPASDVENICYIRKDIVDETVKTAEDHAYFAGQEKLREKMLEWAKEKEEYALTRAVKLAYKTMIDKIEEI